MAGSLEVGEKVRRYHTPPAPPGGQDTGRMGEAPAARTCLTFRSLQLSWGGSFNLLWIMKCLLFLTFTEGQVHPLWREKGAWARPKAHKSLPTFSSHRHHPLAWGPAWSQAVWHFPSTWPSLPATPDLPAGKGLMLHGGKKHWICTPTSLPWIPAPPLLDEWTINSFITINWG